MILSISFFQKFLRGFIKGESQYPKLYLIHTNDNNYNSEMNKTNVIIINKNNNNNDLDIIKSNNNKNNNENIIYKDNNKVKMINIENFGNKKNEGQKYIKKSLNN